MLRKLIFQKLEEPNGYANRTIEELKNEIAAFPAEHGADWNRLNQLFLNALEFQHF